MPAWRRANRPVTGLIPTLTGQLSRLAELAQKFLRAESFARVKGRPDKRHAMSVVVGMDGRPTPVHDEFAITDMDRNQVDAVNQNK